jgi:hypothetical protein
LQVIEAVTIIADEKLRLRGFDLQAWTFGIVLKVDGSREAKVSEHGIENFFCSVFGFHEE